MFEFQTHLIFPTHAVAPAGPLPPSAERLSTTTSDGDTLQGIYIPAAEPDPSRTLVLGFGGNAWNGQDVAEYLHELFPEHDVVAFHYRGYAPSTGTPSAAALIADAPLVYDAAVDRTKPKRVIAVGFSIGTGIAAQLSTSCKLAGLVLVTPFDSLKSVAQSMYPWLPIGPFFEHEIDAAGPLRNSRLPIAIIAAEHDEIVPAERTDALRHVISSLVYDRAIAGAGHNDIYARSEFQEDAREALATVSGNQISPNPGTR
jgi:pimeloyl-ACP methyl ester carboxylesterase